VRAAILDLQHELALGTLVYIICIYNSSFDAMQGISQSAHSIKSHDNMKKKRFRFELFA